MDAALVDLAAQVAGLRASKAEVADVLRQIAEYRYTMNSLTACNLQRLSILVEKFVKEEVAEVLQWNGGDRQALSLTAP